MASLRSPFRDLNEDFECCDDRPTTCFAGQICLIPTPKCPSTNCSKPGGNDDCPECTAYDPSWFDAECDYVGQGSETISWSVLASEIAGLVSLGGGPPFALLDGGLVDPGTTVWIKTEYTLTFTLKGGNPNPGCITVQLTSSASGICYPWSGVPAGMGEASNGFGDPAVVVELNPPAQRGALSSGSKVITLPLNQDGVALYVVTSNASATAVVLSEHIDAGTRIQWEILDA